MPCMRVVGILGALRDGRPKDAIELPAPAVLLFGRSSTVCLGDFLMQGPNPLEAALPGIWPPIYRPTGLTRNN